MHSSKEILKATFEGYQKATKKGRKELLDRLVPVTGLNRRYLASARGNYGRKGDAAAPGTNGKKKQRPAGNRGGRPVNYGEGIATVLAAIGDDYGTPCGKLLVPMIPTIMDFLAESKTPDYGIPEELRELLLEVSAAQADILLKPARDALKIRGQARRGPSKRP